MIHRGVIEEFRGSRDSGVGYLIIDGVPVPCENPATIRALQAAFGGVVGEGHTVDNFSGGHVGQAVFYSLDDLGLLEAFTPCSEAPQALIREYERQGKPKQRRKAKRAGEATQ